MRGIIFILGGARSGKSRFALRLGEKLGSSRGFVATAEPKDAEMRDRIKAHQASRDSSWQTYEESLDLCGLLKKLDAQHDVLLVDCLTLWLSNLMELDEETYGARRQAFLETLGEMQTPIILISNEVGLGGVSANPMARAFCDRAGSLHQEVAALASEVYWMVASIPTKIKGPLDEDRLSG